MQEKRTKTSAVPYAGGTPALPLCPRYNAEMEKTLRMLIVIEVVLTAAGVVSDMALEGLLPQELRAYLAKEDELPFTGMDAALLILLVPLLILIIAGWIQLWRLQPNGRFLYTVAWVCSFPLTVIAGPVVESGLTNAFYSGSTLIGGIIIGMTYFSELRTKFS